MSTTKWLFATLLDALLLSLVSTNVLAADRPNIVLVVGVGPLGWTDLN
jgi:hypothetical protein